MLPLFLLGQSTTAKKSDANLVTTHQCISDVTRTKIALEIEKTRTDLVRKGRIPIAKARKNNAPLKFDWPLRQATNFNDPGYYVIDAGVDHKPGTGLQDYNCNATPRTYEEHRGIDIGIYPFQWHKVNDNQVEVIAAETGIIMARQDGFSDKNCGDSEEEGNCIVLLHSDGSLTTYAHLKKNSITTLPIGSTVEKGAYLGIVASSGNSDAPHLHFEVEDQMENLIDPFAGPCNSLNGMTSWWATQKPYYETRINKIMSNKSVGIEEFDCPMPTNKNIQNQFDPSSEVCFTSFLVHEQANLVLKWRVFAPNNSLFISKDEMLTSSDVESFYEYCVNVNAVEGLWRLEVTLGTQMEKHSFTVGSIPPCPSVLQLTENPSTDSTYKAADTLSSTSLINNTLNIHYKAGKAITLKNGFEAKKGCSFSAIIENCTAVLVAQSKNINYSEKPSNSIKALQVFPNPFKQQATITYYLSQPAKIQLHLYDVTGQLVATILRPTLVDKGFSTIDWNAELPLSGIYFLVLNSSENRVVKKVILQP